MNAMWLRSGTLAAVVILSAPVSYAGAMQTGGGGTQPSHPATTAKKAAGQMSERQQHDFIMKLAQANIDEIELGKIAVQKASSPEVKKYAQMLVDDHTKSNQDLMPIAQQLGVKMPTAMDKKRHSLADKLAKAQGAEFDREYIRAMVTDHQADIKEVKPVASHATTPGTTATGTSGQATTGDASHRVAELAANTMPVLEKHLSQAEQLEKTVGGGKHK